MTIRLAHLLHAMVHRGGTELHLGAFRPPFVRIDGKLVPLDMPPLEAKELDSMLIEGLSEGIGLALKEADIYDYTWALRGLARFSMTTMHDERGSLAVVVKRIDYEILGKREIGIRDDLTTDAPGLYLIGGLPRSGRTTALAAMVDAHNRAHHHRIVVVSDGTHPQHMSKSCTVDHLQLSASRARELLASRRLDYGADLFAFDGLYDADAVAAMLIACRRGLRVVSTCFGATAMDVVRNLLMNFPAGEQPMTLAEIARWFRWIMTVLVVPPLTGRRPVLASEVLVATPQVREMIAAARYDNIDKIFALDDPASPQISLEKSLRQLIARRQIAAAAAAPYLRP